MTAAAQNPPVKSIILALVIGAGELLIFADTWRRVDGRYSSEGLITEALMCIIMGGIPGIAFAGVVYVIGEFLAKQWPGKARPVAEQPVPERGKKVVSPDIVHDD